MERGFAEADVVVEAEYRTQTVPQLDGNAPRSAEWEAGNRLNVYISTQFIWGVRGHVAEHYRLPPDHARSFAASWAAVRLEERRR